jgi:hypothetical protein
VTELVSRLTCTSLVAIAVLCCSYALDPVFGFWLPLYYPTKLALISWLAFPQTGGAELILQKYIEPALHRYEDWLLQSEAPSDSR